MKIFNVNKYTDAPKQLEITRLVRAPIEEVWAVVADHQGMTQWMPMIKHVNLVKPNPQGNWEEGCERHCKFGNDLLKEKIAFWDPPHGYAYMIEDMHLVKNHIAHVHLIEKLNGTLVTWTQYFHPNGNAAKKWMAKNVMLPYVMKKALKNLEKKLTA
ncbi:SRPBCC family protein [Flavobacteriaceae bacterium M23B6Z8]